MVADPIALTAVLVALVALSEWLDRRTPLRHLGAALLVIVLTAIVANAGIIPTYGEDARVYGAVFDHVAPLGIFWLLLLVDLRSLRRAGGPTLVLFLIGSAGTVAGVLLGHAAVGGARAFGPLHAALAGMFTGTYTGGAVNFNAIALEYRVVENGSLYAGAAAVDNAMTTVWMAATVALPRLLAPLWPSRSASGGLDADAHLPPGDEIETTSVFDMSVVIALGVAAVATSDALASGLRRLTGIDLPSVLVLTTLALVLAQLPVVQRLRGTRVLGLFAVYLFLAVIGALCDVEALVRIGGLAPALVGFVAILIGVHGLLTFGAARALRIDADVAAVASQANIGGGTSALALARSLGRGDLELPAILVGSLGNALGNYLGFLVAFWLGA
ncbi:MAG: DUF819 family protein [Acidobacteriota bacterium]|jgi:uncharacterized membrane protein